MKLSTPTTFLFSLVFVHLIAISALGAEVASISIESTSVGLGYSGKSKIHFTRNSAGYDGEITSEESRESYEILEKNSYEPKIIKSSSSHKYQIPKEEVERFLKSLQTPPVPSLDLEQFDITQEKLDRALLEQIEEITKDYSAKDYPTLEARKAQVLERLSIIEAALWRIEDHYNSEWTDDYLSVKIKIELNNGDSIEVSSHSQHMYMIPWTVARIHEEVQTTKKTYDINISQMLSHLFPEKTQNYDRITADSSFLKVGRGVWALYMLPSTLEVDKLFLEQLKPVYRDFSILDAKIISEARNNHLDACCERPDPGKTELYLFLSNKSWPTNFTVRAMVPVEGSNLNWDSFSPSDIFAYADSVLSVSWLKEIILRRPSDPVFFSYRKGVSIDTREYEKIMTKFKKEIKSEVNLLPYSRNTVRLDFMNFFGNRSRLLVLPDKSTLLDYSWGDYDSIWREAPFYKKLKGDNYIHDIWILSDGKTISP